MRISDWSSDVCSSDLSPSHTHAKSAFIYAYVISGAIESKVNDGETRIYRAGESWSEPPDAIHSISRNASKAEPAKLLAVFVLDTNDNPLRSEEHTSELQSLMRISYAVFCLKKKKNLQKQQRDHHRESKIMSHH